MGWVYVRYLDGRSPSRLMREVNAEAERRDPAADMREADISEFLDEMGADPSEARAKDWNL